jgi:hypothetical protein
MKPSDSEIINALEVHGSINAAAKHLRSVGYSFRATWMVEQCAMLRDRSRLDHSKRPSNSQIVIALEATDGNVKAAARILRQQGFEFRTIWFNEVCRECEDRVKETSGGYVQPPTTDRKRLTGKCFIFTSAQNNTKVHDGFFKSLEHLAHHRNASIYVGRFSYNKDGWSQAHNILKGSDELWYDERLHPYFVDEQVQVCDGLVFCGELDILPTAAVPLSGLDSYTKSDSGIVPHAKMHMASIPTMKNDPVKFMYTTGAVTLRNYIQRKAGQKAEHHHVFGALIVEEGSQGEWYVRQISATNDGSFYDLNTLYTPDGVDGDSHPVEGISWGDVHLEKVDPKAVNAAWVGKRSMMSVLKPRHQFIHDVTDFMARSHHNKKDPYHLAKMYSDKTDSVQSEIIAVRKFLQKISKPECMTVVVESNHDQALTRWLKDPSGCEDPANAKYWHYLNYKMHCAVESGDRRSSLEFAVGNLDNVLFLPEDDSYMICKDSGGIECGVHGHRGPNGSRGTPQCYRRCGSRMNTGHTHSAGIIDGVYTAGVIGKLDMGYNVGMSSWSHSSIVTYKNGKRCIVTMRDVGGKSMKWHANAKL